MDLVERVESYKEIFKECKALEPVSMALAKGYKSGTPLQRLKILRELGTELADVYSVEIPVITVWVNAVDLSILTDTIGCYTKGSIHPYAHGFWGHDKAYCKDGGKNMSVAESWATWNYIREVGSDDEKALIERLMPNTYGYYSGVYSEIAKWLKKNTL